jgi:hypothetical protein
VENKNNFEIINLFFIVSPRTIQRILVQKKSCIGSDLDNVF